jgi:predicted outer membrane repeat protein
MKRILIVLTSLSLIAGFAVATPRPATAAPSFSTYGAGDIDLYVSQYGVADGVDDGGSCADPDFNTIQGAVDYAELEYGDATEIYICNGIYYEAIDATIGLTLVGEHRLKTIIDGSQNGAMGIGDLGIINSTNGVSVWDMTIRNGSNDNIGIDDGGAIYSQDSVDCYNSVFRDNYSDDDGGAIFAQDNVYAQDCLFETNESDDDGGAIFAEDDFSSLRSTYSDNYSEEDGGAVHTDELLYSTLDVYFSNESEDEDGGAIYVSSGDEVSAIDRSVFRENVASSSGDGGAVYYSSSYRLTIISSSFINNYAGYHGGALHLDGSVGVPEDYLTIAGGVRTPTIFQGNYAGEDGGAINVLDDYGTLGMSVANARFTDNIAAWEGGAISSANEINLTGTTFTGNRSLGEDGVGGGAVYGEESITVSRSTFTRNSAIDTDGGAIWADDNLTVTSSTFTNNAADDGGAIQADDGTLTVEGSTFTGNQAQGDLDDEESCDDDGPAFCAGEGGAIFTSAEETLITRSTFKNNSATDEGGAIMGDEDGGTPELRIRNSTFIGNQAEEAGALSSRTLDFIELRGNLFQANRAYGVDFTPNFDWAVGAVMVETAGDPWVIAGNRFISNVGWGVGAFYFVGQCGAVPTFDQASMRANTWRSNRVTGGQPQIYRDVRTDSSFDDDECLG